MINSLDEARKEINRIDAEMAKLFEKRMGAAKVIAEYKKERGLPILDEQREREIIKKNSMLISDEELKEYYASFLKGTMATSRAYQARIISGAKVAFSGTEGAFAHIAAKKLFPGAKMVAYGDFKSAYKAVEEGECDICVLPVENSYNGEVGQVTDLMFSGSLFVNDMMELAVDQALLGVPGAKLEDIKTVVSHPQALGQCAEYIRKKGFATEEFSNTALAAKHVAELGDKSVCAIASGDAAEIFGLEVLEKNINEARSNTTRFAVFGRSEAARDPKIFGTHSIILFTVRNEAGALAKAIDVIGSHGFNMRTLRSRPMKELLWEYYFYVEAEGNVKSEEGKKMSHELSKFCDKLKFVGSYVKY